VGKNALGRLGALLLGRGLGESKKFLGSHGVWDGSWIWYFVFWYVPCGAGYRESIGWEFAVGCARYFP
jgi:hypothetical protein